MKRAGENAEISFLYFSSFFPFRRLCLHADFSHLITFTKRKHSKRNFRISI